MPTILELYGYRIFLWSGEGNPLEPVHFHICKGNPRGNTTKIWITDSGGTVVAYRDNDIPEHDLRRLLRALTKHLPKIAAIYTAVTGCADFYEE